VGTARLTCGQPANRSPSAQLTPKREHLSQVSEGLYLASSYQSWIFPRDPDSEDFEAKPTVTLDLYRGFTAASRCGPATGRLSVDAKSSIQARSPPIPAASTARYLASLSA
jgi:hypothetical protein